MATQRDGDWIQTYTGRKLYPWDPRPEELEIVDIAYGLRDPRFGCHTKGAEIYTVAEHCVRVSYLVDDHEPWQALAALLHDAHEFVFKDMPAPVKRHPAMAGYRAGCEKLQRVINVWAGLYYDCHRGQAVKLADLTMLATERRDLMAEAPEEWGPLPAPLPTTLGTPWSPANAAERFLERYRELTT